MEDLTLMQFLAGFTIPSVICLALGIALLVVEMFTPGFGAAGISGLILLVLSIILRAGTLAEALWMTVLVMAIVGVLLLLFLRSATKGAISRSPLVLKDAIDKQAGYISSEDLQFFVGKEGNAITILRPAGTADFDGIKLDVVTEGQFIEAQTKVKVMRVEGRRIIVRTVAG